MAPGPPCEKMRSPCTVLFCKVGEQSVSLNRKLKIVTVIIAWFPRARHCCRWIGGTLQWMRKERSLLPWRSHSRGRERRQMISLSLVSPLPVTLGSLRPFPSGHSSERGWHEGGEGTEGAQREPQGDRKLLTEKETFEQRPEQREGTRTGQIWRRWPSSRETDAQSHDPRKQGKWLSNYFLPTTDNALSMTKGSIASWSKGNPTDADVHSVLLSLSRVSIFTKSWICVITSEPTP